MTVKPISTCLKKSCNDCNVRSRIACHYNPGQLIRFYIIVLPSFIIGGMILYQHSIAALIGWAAIAGMFFLIIETRVLCSHCPRYNESPGIIRCWANYGIPKLWDYQPVAMNIFEKVILVSGFVVVWGYPVVFLQGMKNRILWMVYPLSVALFFILLSRFNCNQCIHFSCPLNRVKKKVREAFLQNNPQANHLKKLK
ncbi:MAG: hypothetical protein JW723_11330 [Bacteroidales bacterium]|nr:hypothetical protein [Bacteroidales bacterium]